MLLFVGFGLGQDFNISLTDFANHPPVLFASNIAAVVAQQPLFTTLFPT